MKRIYSFLTAVAIIINVAVCTVLPVHADDNVALGKPVWVNSQYAEAHVPERLTDGTTSGIWASGSMIMHETPGYQAYAQVDLQSSYNISKIIVRSRRDKDQTSDRMGWVVHISEYEDFSVYYTVGSKDKAGAFGEDLEIDLSPARMARYVRVVRTNGSMTLSEIEVYGTEIAKFDYESVDADIYNRIQLNKYLDIIKPVSETDFGLKELVTRQEAAAAAVKAGGYTLLNNTQLSFSDVSADSEYLPYINTALSAGIISPADTFRPTDYATVGEFTKMLLVTLGYSNRVAAFGGYPSGVMKVALELDLTSDSDFGFYDVLNKETAVKILYNALTAPCAQVESMSQDGTVKMEKGDTLLENSFDLRLYTGIVTENDMSTLKVPKNNSENYVAVGTDTFTDESGIMALHLGENMMFLADDKDRIKIAWSNKDDTTVVRLDSDDISKIEDTRISADDGAENKSTYRLAVGASIIYNGVAEVNYKSLSECRFDYGYAELIDNDGDRTYEVIRVWNPTVIIAHSIFDEDDDYYIFGKNNQDIVISDYDRINILRNGKPATIDLLKEDDLIMVYSSSDGKYTLIEAFSDKAEGTVTAISSDELEISGVSYPMSKYFTDKCLDKLALGTVGSFNINGSGEVFWYDDDNSAIEGETLAIIVGCTYKAMGDTTLRVFTQDKVMADYTVKDNIVLDGKRTKRSEINSLIDTNPAYLAGKLARITVSGDELKAIDTENYISSQEPDSNIRKVDTDVPSSVFRSYNGLYTESGMVLPILMTTPTFVVPVDRYGMPQASEEYWEHYTVSAFSSRVSQLEKLSADDGEYSFYMPDELGFSDAVVYRYVRNTSTSDIFYVNQYTSTYVNNVVIEQIFNRLDENGNICYGLRGVDIASGNKVDLTFKYEFKRMYDSGKIYNEKPSYMSSKKILKPSSISAGGQASNYIINISELKKGDIIRYMTNSAGKISNAEKIYDADANTYSDVIYSVGNNATYPSANFRMFAGELGEMTEDRFTLQSASGNFEGIDISSIRRIIVVDDDGVEKYSPEYTKLYLDYGIPVLGISASSTINTLIIYK